MSPLHTPKLHVFSEFTFTATQVVAALLPSASAVAAMLMMQLDGFSTFVRMQKLAIGSHMLRSWAEGRMWVRPVGEPSFICNYGMGQCHLKSQPGSTSLH